MVPDHESNSTLPREVKLRGLSWEDTLGYLKVIVGYGAPVLLSAADAPIQGRWLLETRGYLCHGAAKGTDEAIYLVEWPLGKRNGVIRLLRDQFECGYLETMDGYFHLVFSLGGWCLVISDDSAVSWPK